MSLGSLIVFILFSVFLGLNVCTVWKNIRLKGKSFEGNKTLFYFKSVVLFLLIPVMFPTALFLTGLFYSNWIFVPTLVRFIWVSKVWSLFLTIIIPVFIYEMFRFFVLKKKLVEIQLVNDKSLRYGNATLIAITQSLIESLKPGLFEEYLFRFLWLIPIQVLVMSFLPAHLLVSIAAAFQIPWLTLGVGRYMPIGLFVAAVIINAIFAFIHIFRDAKMYWSPDLIVRVIYAWYLGMTFVLALYTTGFLGSVILHTLADFILFTPIFIKSFHDLKNNMYSRHIY